ncbi:MAG TPA: hypothetical protein VGD95_07730 [Micavibrio sp.]
MEKNKPILIVIALLLLGILGFLVIEQNQRPQTLGGAIGEAVEEVGDEIDDATTR